MPAACRTIRPSSSIPLAFALLLAQGFSELIKRLAIMQGELADVHASGGHHAAAEAEAERLVKALAEEAEALERAEAGGCASRKATRSRRFGKAGASTLWPPSSRRTWLRSCSRRSSSSCCSATRSPSRSVPAACCSSSSASSWRRCRTAAINLSWPLLQSMPERIYGVMSNDTLLAIPFFTFMGLMLERSGMAEDLLDTIGQLFGTITRRPRLRGDLRRRAAGGDHRRRRRIGDLDGPDLAADHAALRLRPARRLRRHRGVRHARADHPAVAGADRDGRPARPLGRRHVRRRLRARRRALRPLCLLHLAGDHVLPGVRPWSSGRRAAVQGDFAAHARRAVARQRSADAATGAGRPLLHRHQLL